MKKTWSCGPEWFSESQGYSHFRFEYRRHANDSSLLAEVIVSGEYRPDNRVNYARITTVNLQSGTPVERSFIVFVKSFDDAREHFDSLIRPLRDMTG